MDLPFLLQLNNCLSLLFKIKKLQVTGNNQIKSLYGQDITRISYRTREHGQYHRLGKKTDRR